MKKKYNDFVNEAVSKRIRYIEEGKEIIRNMLEEAYIKGHAYSSVDFLLRYDIEIFFDEFFLMKEFDSYSKIYVKYKDSVMTVKAETNRNFYTAVYKEMTVDEFKNMLETRSEILKATLEKLK